MKPSTIGQNDYQKQRDARLAKEVSEQPLMSYKQCIQQVKLLKDKNLKPVRKERS